MAYGARDRMVYAAAQLVRRQGVSGTGLRQVVERAEAPRGSLQHYFPGGKDQLVREALGWSAEFAAGRVEEQAAASRTPGELFERMAGQWADELRRRNYAAGCPLVATAADAAADESLRTATSAGFATWLAPIREALERMGVPAARCAPLATLMLSALEGAIVLARADRDDGPLRTVTTELRPLLDAAALR